MHRVSMCVPCHKLFVCSAIEQSVLFWFVYCILVFGESREFCTSIELFPQQKGAVHCRIPHRPLMMHRGCFDSIIITFLFSSFAFFWYNTSTVSKIGQRFNLSWESKTPMQHQKNGNRPTSVVCLLVGVFNNLSIVLLFWIQNVNL